MFISKSILIALLFFCSTLASALSIVAKEEAPYIGNELPNKGLSIDIVNTVLLRAGYETEVIFETWPRSYEGGEIGIYDVIGSIWKTAEREQYFVFSDAYLFHEIKFIKRKKDTSIKFDTISDLGGLVVGILKNYEYQKDFSNSRNIIKLQQNHLIQNLLFLTQEQVDVTVGDVRKIQYEINKYMKSKMKDLEFLPQPLNKQSVHIAVSKSNPKHKEIISQFNEALKAIKSDGSYQKIIKKHQQLY